MPARLVNHSGYNSCIQLDNSDVKIVIDPNFGGRLLEYSIKGNNIIYTIKEEEGFVYSENKNIPSWLSPHGGRFDIGPEMIVPPHPELWYGKWDWEISGDYLVTLISHPDNNVGVQLLREFILEKKSSRLWFTQTIKNISNSKKKYCHWGRTFAVGGGICVVPLNPESRYPRGYLLYGPGDVMDYRTVEDGNLRVRNGMLEIIGPPERAKLAIDASEGWIAYFSRSDLLFIKKFPVFPDKMYGEMAANSVSIWYNKNEMCEIEPIGPWEDILPGMGVSFTEEWLLLEYSFPTNTLVDHEELKKRLHI